MTPLSSCESKILIPYWFNLRYHGDERLLPEYDSSMSDNVQVVEDPSGSASEENVEGFYDDSEDSEEDSTFLSSFVEEEPPQRRSRNSLQTTEALPKRSMYLATLKLYKVRPEQKGIYKCGPSNTRSASVELHITDGNRQT